MPTPAFAGRRDAITDVDGITVGHWTNRRAATGCTVVLARDGAVAGYHRSGGAPETIATDVLSPDVPTPRINAVLMAGGSAFGLTAASGVRDALRDQGVGSRFGPALPPLPIVVGAVVFDLGIGSAFARPEAEHGRRAVERAGRAVREGSVGVGTGCTVAKGTDFTRCLKGGLGTASLVHESGLTVGAIAAVNAIGDVVDPETGTILAGPRGRRRGQMGRTTDAMLQRPLADYLGVSEEENEALERANTTLTTVATNARLDKAQATRLAMMATAGLARVIRPAHLPGDGDTLFALATGTHDLDRDAVPRVMALLGTMAAEAVTRALLNGINAASGLHGVPSAAEWRRRR